MSQKLWENYFNTGLESAKSGLVETAIDYFQWAIKINPDNHEIHYNLGVSYMTLGKIEDAIKSLSESIKINDDNSDAYANRAICYAYNNDEQKSKKDFKIAVDKGALESGLNQVIGLLKKKGKKLTK